METGFDILFFWVARMAMLTNYFTNHKLPFETIYLHAMVNMNKIASERSIYFVIDRYAMPKAEKCPNLWAT